MTIFTTTTFTLTGQVGWADEIIAIDIDRDGFEDLLFGSVRFPFEDTANTLQILKGDGSGGFTEAPTLFSGPAPDAVHPREIVTADFNNDGYLDVFLAATGYDADPFPGEPPVLLLGTADGKLLDASSQLNIPWLGFMHSADAADVDGDGDIDLVAGNMFGASYPAAYVLLNDGTANFTHKAGALPSEAEGAITTLFIDADDDGDLDLFLGKHDAAHQLLINDGTGSFSTGATLPAPLFGSDNSVTVASKAFDFDADGRNDILVASTHFDPFYNGARLQVLRANGDGTFADMTSSYIVGQPTDAGWIRYAEFADLNNDGALDIICEVEGATNRAHAYINNGANVFYLAPPDAFGIEGATELIDVNTDGWMDIVSFGDANESGERIVTVHTRTPAASPTQTGTAAADLLLGTSAADTIQGGGGGDLLAGAAANDILNGDDGNDTVLGGSGDDLLTGGAGNDMLDGGTHDTEGDTASYAASTAGVTINLATGAASGGHAQGDKLSGIENVIGSGKSDILTGDSGANELDGGAGNDTLDGGAGADTLIGGTGNDVYIVDDAGDVVTESGTGTADKVQSRLTAYTLTANVENLTLLGGLAGEFTTGTGNTLNNVITGDDADNELAGLDGNDTLVGGKGDDSLSGDIGVDKLIGGEGNDEYILDVDADTITELAKQGIDRVVTKLVSYTLGANLEELRYNGGGPAFAGTGNTLDNNFANSSAVDKIKGLAGNDVFTFNVDDSKVDTLEGGTGNDIYILGATNENIVETATGGTDTVQAFQIANYSLNLNVENLEVLDYSGTSFIGFGNELNNRITGGTEHDTLSGMGGNDILDGGVSGTDFLSGGSGNDTFVVRHGTVTIEELAGQGTADTVESYLSAFDLSSSTDYDNIEHLTIKGGVANTTRSATGNALANILKGDVSKDTLDGGTDSNALFVDQLIGGLGNDTYLVRDAKDKIVESGNAGTDTAIAFVTHTLAVNVENLVIEASAGSINGKGNTLANLITGNAGNNTLDGSTGVDTVSYVLAGSGVTVDLTLKTATGGGGTDTVLNFENIIGSIHNDTLTGTSAANRIDGGLGQDQMAGGAGNDTYVVDNALDTITDSAGASDTVETALSVNLASDYGGAIENATLTGAAFKAVGNAAANILTGNAVTNELAGGDGKDFFVFKDTLGPANIDTITDFVVLDDTIRLENAIFTAFTKAGALATSAFATGPGAADALDRIIYDSATGALYYDADGTGATAQIQFATIFGNPALTAKDFVIV